MTDDLTKIGRIAFRQEGKWWNAYYAMPDTMSGAIRLGGMLMSAAANPKAKKLFMSAMREVVADIIEDRTGTRPTWRDPETAPEHERAGNA